MDMKRRDFLKMTAALAAAGVSPSLLAAGKEQFTVYGAPAMPSVTIAVAALQGNAGETGGCVAEGLALARPASRGRGERAI